jgi:hypothetical protein
MAWVSVVSVAVGAIITYQAGFHWVGQWQTGKQVAEKMAIAACVKEFLLQPDRGVIYATLKDSTSSYQRSRLLQDQQLASSSNVAQECGNEIGSFDAAMFPAV